MKPCPTMATWTSNLSLLPSSPVLNGRTAVVCVAAVAVAAGVRKTDAPPSNQSDLVRLLVRPPSS
jgi:hypothetical protein